MLWREPDERFEGRQEKGRSEVVSGVLNSPSWVTIALCHQDQDTNAGVSLLMAISAACALLSATGSCPYWQSANCLSSSHLPFLSLLPLFLGGGAGGFIC